jgi:hypothetical protein
MGSIPISDGVATRCLKGQCKPKEGEPPRVECVNSILRKNGGLSVEEKPCSCPSFLLPSNGSCRLSGFCSDPLTGGDHFHMTSPPVPVHHAQSVNGPASDQTCPSTG